MEYSRPLLVFFVIFVFFVCSSCSHTDRIGNGVDVPDRNCIDIDGDSYGVFCEAGLDCNDSDSSIWADCNPDEPCTVPRAGCLCDTEGELAECRTSEPVVSDDGSQLCYAGVRYCENGIWTTCQSMEAYLPNGSNDDTDGDEDGIHRDAILGSSRTCVGSCDAGCRHIYDCPSEPDFTSENSVNLRYDLAYEVAGDPGEPAITYPAATIITEGNTDGYFNRAFSLTCTEDLLGVWWALDFDFQFVEPLTDQGIDIYVRTAPTESDLLPFSDNTGWVRVVACPVERADSECVRPENPYDRLVTAGGNLYDALGVEEADTEWLQMQVHLWRTDPNSPSPRLSHTDVFFFCGDAS